VSVLQHDAALKKAQSSFDAAFISIDKKKLTTAIKQFGNAWANAQNALKYANKGVKQSLDEAKSMLVDIEDSEVEEDEE